VFQPFALANVPQLDKCRTANVGPGARMVRNVMNRRQYRRIRAPIHCRPAGVEFFAPPMEPVDISFGGLRFCSDEEYPVGAALRLDIFPPGASLTVTAEVMWIRGSAEGAPARFDVGLTRRPRRFLDDHELREPVEHEDAGLLQLLMTDGDKRFDDLLDILSRNVVTLRIGHRFEDCALRERFRLLGCRRFRRT